MSDKHDHEQTDREMLTRFGGGSELTDRIARTLAETPEIATRRQAGPLCRFCWRDIFLASNRERDQCEWILIYQEYEDTRVCDARSDGASLSTLPHEPCDISVVAIGQLIKLAADLISPPGDFRDTHEAHDAAFAVLIAKAAGQPGIQESYVERAIRRVAVETRGPAFAKLAHKYGWTS